MRWVLPVCLTLLATPLAAQERLPQMCREPQPSTFVEPGLLGSVERSTDILGQQIKEVAEGKIVPRAFFRENAERFENDYQGVRSVLESILQDIFGRPPSPAEWAQALDAIRAVSLSTALPSDAAVHTDLERPSGGPARIVVRANLERFPNDRHEAATIFLANTMIAVLIAMGEDPTWEESVAIFNRWYEAANGPMCW
ncbi:MAG: hypothetical protein AAFR46_15110 [Pseudomonadota bacterium]